MKAASQVFSQCLLKVSLKAPHPLLLFPACIGALFPSSHILGVLFRGKTSKVKADNEPVFVQSALLGGSGDVGQGLEPLGTAASSLCLPQRGPWKPPWGTQPPCKMLFSSALCWPSLPFHRLLLFSYKFIGNSPGLHLKPQPSSLDTSPSPPRTSGGPGLLSQGLPAGWTPPLGRCAFL